MGINNVLLFFYLIFICFVFNKTKWLGWLGLNNFFDVFFWKLTSLLNNTKYNIYVIIFMYYGTVSFLKKSIKGGFLIIIFFIFFSNMFVNYNDTGLFVFNKVINIALLNGILNIHPWLIYTLYSYTVYIHVVFSKNSIKKTIMFRVFLKNSVKYFYLFVSSSAILLGGYWAFQELSWGGWWNWDIVELVSIYFFYLIVSHSHKKYNYLVYTKIFNYLIVLAVLLSFLIIKFNIINSIHSFISNKRYKVTFYKSLMMFLLIYYSTLLFYNNNVGSFLKKRYYIGINIIVIITIIFIQIIGQWIFKNSLSDYLYILGFIYIIIYIYIWLYIKYNHIYIKYNSYKHHFNINIFILCIFFLKIHFCNYFIYYEVFKNSCVMFNNFSINNSFLKKFKNDLFFQNYWHIWLTHNISEYNLNTEVFKHFYKNWIIFIKNVFIKIITPSNDNVFLVYSNLFLILIPLYFIIFFKNNKLIIN